MPPKPDQSSASLLAEPRHPAPSLAYGVTKAVYGLVFPETRAAVQQLWGDLPHELYENAHRDVQDHAHHVFLDRWRAWASEVVGGLDRFKHAYVTNGSSEGIRDAIWEISRLPVPRSVRPAALHLFAGEYEGYTHYAQAAGVRTFTHARDAWRPTFARDAAPGDVWILSEPFAGDGNLWADFARFLDVMQSAGCTVMADLAYVGAVARPYHMDLAHPAISRVFFSLSKIFGTFYHRIGGVLATEPMAGLEGNRWFKNIFSLALGVRLLQQHSARELPTRYAGVAEQARVEVERSLGVAVTSSDVLLLGTVLTDDASAVASADVRALLREFERAGRSRLCLTPTLARIIQESIA